MIQKSMLCGYVRAYVWPDGGTKPTSPSYFRFDPCQPEAVVVSTEFARKWFNVREIEHPLRSVGRGGARIVEANVELHGIGHPHSRIQVIIHGSEADRKEDLLGSLRLGTDLMRDYFLTFEKCSQTSVSLEPFCIDDRSIA